MNRTIPRAAVLGALLAAVATAQHPAPRAQNAFLPNLGQWEAVVNHYVNHGLMQVWFTDTGYTLQVTESLTPPDPGRNLGREPAPDLRAVALRATLLGSTGPASRRGIDAADGRYHFFLGDDPQRWVTDAPGYGGLRYEGVWPGVDQLWRLHDGVLTYDFELRPFVDPATLRIRLEGQDRLQIRDDGSLAAVTGMGELRHSAPIAFQLDEAGERRSVPCRFRILEPGVYGFVVDGRDPALPLVIDPGLSWSTFLGGFNLDSVGWPDGVAVAANGDVIAGGSTFGGTGFPWTPGAVNMTWGGDHDCWVTRLSASGAMVWSALIGGMNFDLAQSVETEPNGDVTLAGRTDSSNWPTTTGTFQPQFGGPINAVGDGFVTRLSANGSQILWSTFLGGGGSDIARSLRIHPSGVVVVAGWTYSANFPMAGNPYQSALATTSATCTSNSDAWVAVLDPQLQGTAQLVASTYVGGGCDDGFGHIALDANTVWVSGGTLSSAFPTTANGYQKAFGGGGTPTTWGDGVIVQLPLTLNTLMYGTFFGGPGDDDCRMTLDALGRPVLGSWTNWTGLPTTTGAFQSTIPGGTDDGYVAILDPSLPPAQQVVYCTYLGGSAGREGVNDIEVERSGLITVTGSVGSGNYPTTPGAFSTMLGASWDGFVTRIDPGLSGNAQLIYSTYLGGALSWDYPYCLALTADGAAAVGGRTGSRNFPVTPGAFQPIYGGGTRDAFVTVVDMLPTGVSRYGAPSPACHGPLYLSVNSEPVAGNVGFAFLVNEAPANSFGALFLGRPDAAGTPLPFGFTAHLLLAPPPLSINAMSNGLGYCRIPAPLPANFAWPFGGLQSIWLNPGGCALLVASDALR